jgi:hypothetical protein
MRLDSSLGEKPKGLTCIGALFHPENLNFQTPFYIPVVLIRSCAA